MNSIARFATLFFLASAGAAAACPVCERNQRGILKGVAHGAGPDSRWDYLIVGAVAVVVAVTLFFTVKWLIKPGETSGKHIKRMILSEQ